jgi:hypothetical protein
MMFRGGVRIMRIFAIAIVLMPAPALAQGGSAPAGAGRGHYVSRIICERVVELGSRIASRRVCATQAQWDEFRRLTRQEIDRQQQASSRP